MTADTKNAPATLNKDVRVNFPFVMTLEHAPIELRGMFALSEAFDLYEMETAADGRPVKESILVDVLESTKSHTILKITPAEPLTYADLAAHTEVMMDRLGKRLFKAKPNVVSVQWQVGKTGVASDLRGMLRTIT